MEDGGLEINGLEDSISGICIKLLFKFAIAFVLGDCKGHDVLCGRYTSHKILMLCRDCNCSLSDDDDHTVECVMRKVADIKVLTDQPPTKEVSSQLQILAKIRVAFTRQLQLRYCMAWNLLLKPAEVRQFDVLSQGFSDQHKHQSYRDFPRTSSHMDFPTLLVYKVMNMSDVYF
eukprot:scaffold43586_cov39-Attheya_sp.AAC.1